MLKKDRQINPLPDQSKKKSIHYKLHNHQTSEFAIFRFQQLVEHMEWSFTFLLEHNTRFLQQVVFNISTSNLSHWTKMNSNEFTKSRWIVVPDRFGIPKGFKKWVTANNSLFQICLWEETVNVCGKNSSSQKVCSHHVHNLSLQWNKDYEDMWDHSDARLLKI